MTLKTLSANQYAQSLRSSNMSTLVRDVNHLKQLCSENPEEPTEFYILFSGFIRSSKNIMYEPETEMFSIVNEVDDSEQELTEMQLMDSSCKHTNIGRAIIENRFFMY